MGSAPFGEGRQGMVEEMDVNAEQQNEMLLWKGQCASQESTLMGDAGHSWGKECGI